MPVSMVLGAVFYPWMRYLEWISPYLIFVMLCIPYCRLKFRDLKVGKEHFELLAIQMFMAAAVYFALLPLGDTVAGGTMLCVFIPTATAAPVITSLLGGRLKFVASYQLVCNIFVALVGPLVLAAVGTHPELTFFESAWLICRKVFPLLLCPMAVAFLLKKLAPKAHHVIANHQALSFYIWAFSLFIVVGNCVSFAIKNYSAENVVPMLLLALGALVVCLVQFEAGRWLGGKFGDKVSAGQSFGQKNTVLGVWLALTYLDPLSSIGMAAYIIWQNLFNSWQLMRHKEDTEFPVNPETAP